MRAPAPCCSGHGSTFLGADGRQRVAIYSGLGGALVPHDEFGVVEEFSGKGSGSGLGTLRNFVAEGKVHVFVLDR